MSKIRYNIGEIAKKGCYICANCGTHLLLCYNDKVPPCPSCNNTTYTKST